MWILRRIRSSPALTGLVLRSHSPKSSPPDLRPCLLHLTCCRRVQIPAADPNPFLAEEPTEPNDAPLDSFYTPEQRASILQLLNSASEAELSAVKMLRGRKATNIVEYRIRNGSFRDLESIVNVPLLKHKSAAVAFNSILNPAAKRERRTGKIQLAKFIRPEVDKTLLEDSASIVSIVCGVTRVAWTHMDRALTVLDWQQQQCPSFMKGTYLASNYLQDISRVVSNLPLADFFVVEKPSVSSQNTALYPVMAHLRTVEAMLFALLSARREAGTSPNVLNMMRPAVGRHFGLMVGDSRTSSADTVRKLMTESAIKKRARVSFPNDLLLRYSGAFQMNSRNKGEELCDALLQAVAFYELLAS